MSPDIRPAIPLRARDRVGAYAVQSRLPGPLVSAAIAVATTAAVMLVSAIGLTLGLN